MSTALLSGCFDASTTTEDSKSPSNGVTAEEATPRETIGKKTQNVLDLKQALADGAVLASTKIEATNPLGQSADAYRTTVAKVGGMAVTQAIQIRNAQSIKDPKPLTYDEFMSEIIKKGEPNGISLPMLPYYQEYAWDFDAQALVVVDFPARKEAREQQR
ncbi:hypothetical protein Q31b_32120 [Novipirellula aureliae]|uniref:Uncharacterized protein n=2 Tax=Novipirellula aureliae TaxID=2527966 RepID=A0A5C6DXW4_9BACT|nr:hypothetical protein Q31b_32120 [Novipirellula aureliae]